MISLLPFSSTHIYFLFLFHFLNLANTPLYQIFFLSHLSTTFLFFFFASPSMHTTRFFLCFLHTFLPLFFSSSSFLLHRSLHHVAVLSVIREPAHAAPFFLSSLLHFFSFSCSRVCAWGEENIPKKKEYIKKHPKINTQNEPRLTRKYYEKNIKTKNNLNPEDWGRKQTNQ